MNPAAINRTIRVLCSEVANTSRIGKNWQEYTEDALLYEASLCTFSSQMLFEVAEAISERLMSRNLLRPAQHIADIAEYEQDILEAINDPFEVQYAGRSRTLRPRFKTRLVSSLVITARRMQMQGHTLRSLLMICNSPDEARESLINLVWGFGPKQASLFLRRTGFWAEFAVLDTHILDYLRIVRGINPKPAALSRLAHYKQVEAEFKKVAEEFGFPIGCVDLAVWVTMRVAKREAA